MEHYILPNQFLDDQSEHDGVHFHDYRTDRECEKSKIILKDNAFSFLLQGTKHVYNETETARIGSEEFVFMRSGNYLMSEKTIDQHEYRSQLLFFDNRFLTEFAIKYPQFRHTKRQQSGLIKGVMDDYIRHFLKSVHYLNPKDTLSKKVKLEEILLHLIQKQGWQLSDLFEHEHKEQQLKVQDVVQNNLDNNLQVAELAFLCNMSISTFKRHFESVYHTSPIRWMQEKRLENAAQKLLESHNRVNDLYLESGYQSLSSFIQAFRQKYGQTPKQFQKQHLNV